jgi:hypothetical protein
LEYGRRLHFVGAVSVGLAGYALGAAVTGALVTILFVSLSALVLVAVVRTRRRKRVSPEYHRAS